MRIIVLSLAVLCIILTSCENKKKEEADETTEVEVVENIVQDEIKKVSVTLVSESGSNAKGTVEFIQDEGVVKMIANLTGLTPGSHSIHIYDKEEGTWEDGTSAGENWKSTFAPDGEWISADGFHKGDLKEIKADQDGNASLIIKTNEWCIECGDEKKDIMGRAIVVYQSTGGSGSQPKDATNTKVSCGGTIE